MLFSMPRPLTPTLSRRERATASGLVGQTMVRGLSQRWILGVILSGTGLTGISAAEIPKAQLEFFETKIRPILAENCYKCHSPAQAVAKVKGGLELDWKGGWEKGGDDGLVIKPGDPDRSLLIKAVRYQDEDLQMPPKTPLKDEQVADLVKWVEMGAPDPRTERPKKEKPLYVSKGKEHWAFQPVTHPVPPAVQDGTWGKSEIDKFVLAKLEASGMRPNWPADKRTLIRRVYFDLIGLPPTPAQVADFLADDSANAFEKVVDSLLASPQYGERWARHWLDVARYSDTKGQPNRRLESPIYPYAWTYRDYVINAFNSDKPYNQFILEQLAADKVQNGRNSDSLAALGFLTLGDRFNGNANDVINDRIDVTTKAFLGLTVSCARCHDHKFDPIPQADYYSLRGIFASSVEPQMRPMIVDPSANPIYQEYLVKRGEMDLKIEEARTQNMKLVFGEYKKLAGAYLYATTVPVDRRDAYLKDAGADPVVYKNWETISKGGAAPVASILQIWYTLSRIPEDRFADQAKRVLAVLGTNPRANNPLNPYVVQAFKGTSPRNLGEVASMYGQLFAKEDPLWDLVLLVSMNDAVYRFLPNQERNKFLTLRDQSDALELAHPGTPSRAMALEDLPTPQDSPIFLRGEAENRGPVVPRRFLEVLSGPNRPVFRTGSGRLELAEAIANPNNPLTARVLVNRVWLHHFGEGIVSNPDDLGNQSSPPSHPELLDYLATTFMKQGWSIKKLHKQILMSATYQQSSEANPSNVESDPFNRLLWRANVRRMEFEPLRDSFLYIGGTLDLTLGGHPVDLSDGTRRGQGRGASAMASLVEYRVPGASRRTIYGYIDRSDVVDLLPTFDFASPDIPMGKRYETTVPQQALFLMNSPLVIEQVRNVVNREEFKSKTDDASRVRYLYDLFFQRLPSPDETALGIDFVAAFHPAPIARGGPVRDGRAGAVVAAQARGGAAANGARRGGAPARPQPLDGWQEFAHALLMTNEAMFVN